MSIRTHWFRRLLAAPGREAALRDVAVEVEDGRIRSVRPEGGAAGRRAEEDLLALPAMVNAHDHGYGLRPLALGGADDALECWIASLTGRPTIDPWLEAAVAFGRMAHSGIGATVHCHNSLAAERLADEAAGVARAAADVGIRVAFSCPILDRNAFAYGDQRALLPNLDPVDRARLTESLARTAPAEHLVDQVEGIAAAFESERFRVQYGPIGPQWCQDATLERSPAPRRTTTGGSTCTCWSRRGSGSGWTSPTGRASSGASTTSGSSRPASPSPTGCTSPSPNASCSPSAG